jgi:carbonic anhydrase
VYFSEIENMKATVILTCMDPRADPKDFWKYGDAACIRNVGGCATEDALKSIRFLAGVMSDRRNTVGVVAVVHHTDCGLHGYSEDEIRASLAKQAKLDDGMVEKLEEKPFGSWKG